MAKFNELENLFEIELSPERLRDIAAQLESRAKSEFFLAGQVIRFKINHRFAITFKPTKLTMPESKEPDDFDELETEIEIV